MAVSPTATGLGEPLPWSFRRDSSSRPPSTSACGERRWEMGERREERREEMGERREERRWEAREEICWRISVERQCKTAVKGR